MFTFQDEKRVRDIVKEETDDIRQTVKKTAINVDKILKMFVRLDQEHTLTQAKINKHDKGLRKVEKILNLPSTHQALCA